MRCMTQILAKLIFGNWLKICNWRNFNLAKACFLNKLAFHLACEVVMRSSHNYFRLDWYTHWLMLTNYSNLGNAKLAVPVNWYSYTIHMHVVFSIDTPFLAPQNSFRMWKLHVWKAVYMAFIQAFMFINAFGHWLHWQESAFHVKQKTVMHSTHTL